MPSDASAWDQVDPGVGVGTGGSREELFVCLDVSEAVEHVRESTPQQSLAFSMSQYRRDGDLHRHLG